jgi:hypothetical protein
MEVPPCDLYLKSKSSTFSDDQVHMIVSKLLKADPDPNGANCKWIIDSYLRNEFRIDEDEERVKDDIILFKIFYGDRNPLPKKGYKEMKVMIREKSEKETKKSIAKSKKSQTITTFNDCESFFKNIKNSLPEPYKSYDKEQSYLLFEEIEKANPTSDFKNCIWIVEELKKGNIQEEELPRVKQYLERYFKKFPRLPLPKFYPNFPVTSNYQLVKDAVDDIVYLLYTGDDGILLVPRLMEASCYYGAQTSWCTAQKNKNNMYIDYSQRGHLYIWFDKNLKNKYQFHFQEVQFMDKDDNPISKELFNYFRNHRVLKRIFKEEMNRISEKVIFNEKMNRLSDKEKIINYIPFLSERWLEAEEKIIKDRNISLRYAKDVIKGRWPQDEEIGRQAEQIIIKDPKSAYEYARDAIKGRWPRDDNGKQAELMIMKNNYNIQYARDVIKGRWPKDDYGIRAEQIIIEGGPHSAYEYARDVIKGKWPQDEEIGRQAEKIIMKDTYNAFDYAKM